MRTATLGLGLGLWALATIGAAGSAGAAPTADEARSFIDAGESRLLELGNRLQRAQWVMSTFITEDTERLAADANKDYIAATMELAKAAKRFDGLALPEDVARRILLLKLSLPMPAPADPRLQGELTEIAAGLEGSYGRGKYCPPGKECLDLNALERILATSRNPDALLDAWKGWHAISPPMRPRYARFVELANQGARDLGFADVGALWRSGYDMPPDAFSRELARLWAQVRPLYLSLHAYVRGRLGEHYGAQLVPPDGAIPSHLLGNMWAQGWGNIYPLVAPAQEDPGFDLDALLKAKRVDARELVRYGERFFTSLGFAPLPGTFWERSLFVKPRDRDVVCHASAWDVDNDQDLRIKMCIETNAEDFVTVHHELGHNFYQRAYRAQPYLFRNGANDGFHEAIGDAIALSVTPGYLQQIGLLDKAPPPGQGEIALLLRMALDKVAFLPFGLLIDEWRFKVFSGEVRPDGYNAAWWDLKRSYQGVAPPVARSEADFDPGAKYHVPANVPYTRYFLADILEFQFHRALCRAAGQTGPLSRCSIYGNKAAGERFARMLELGQSRPWPEALEAVTGERTIDAGALLEYFAPLQKWLDQQNRGKKVGFYDVVPGPPAHRSSSNVASLAALQQKVREREQAFAKTMADRDPAAFASFVSEEALFIGGGVLRGRKAVVDGWRPLFAGKTAPFSWTPELVEVIDPGTLALSRGPVFAPDGTRTGTFSSTWRLEPDGEWRVVLDSGCPPCRCDAAPSPAKQGQ